jgi:dihydrofolate reductase
VVTKVVFDISVSLDGFITASGQTADEPLGIGGERLHELAFSDERGQELLSEAVGATGAVDGRTVAVGGGAETGRQFIRSRLADELSLHVVPILFGGGTRLFRELDELQGLEQIAMDVSTHATHLRYRVAR